MTTTSAVTELDHRPSGRAALLEAAHAELVDHGPSALSLRAVARRAGLSHAAPKHHFGDRTGLLTALATEGFRLFEQRLAEVSANAPAAREQRLVALGRAYLDFGRDHPALLDLMFRTHELDRDDADYMAGGMAAFRRIVSAVDGAGAGGALTPGPGDDALVAWAFIHGLVTLSRTGTRVPGTQSALAEAGDHLVGVFARRFA
jgi:AcrR family transcriptional regulator